MPVFKGTGWKNDCKMVQLTDLKKTLAWVQARVSTLSPADLWEGTDLTVVAKVDMKAQLEKRIRCSSHGLFLQQLPWSRPWHC